LAAIPAGAGSYTFPLLSLAPEFPPGANQKSHPTTSQPSLSSVPANPIMPRLCGRGRDPVAGTGLMTIKLILWMPRA